ncbi:hypothetical protein [Actinomadura rupiterrae]|uniref:hypothetical protein n=1 Tax=Actinomadura rupiterrae TaxID=559627 RepID=UPI0020A3F58D|nr:hypothetical protein [Actinomadura rupiterrae]MCP2342304.1 hypothetical protein [Actinomadura rupiterrae]
MPEPDDELLPFPPSPPLTDLSLEEPTARAEVRIVRAPERRARTGPRAAGPRTAETRAGTALCPARPAL